jgi:hypothetical protein
VEKVATAGWIQGYHHPQHEIPFLPLLVVYRKQHDVVGMQGELSAEAYQQLK